MKSKTFGQQKKAEPRQVRIALTADELIQRQRDLIGTQTCRDEFQARLDPEIQKLDGLKAKAKNLSYAVATGFEFREVECAIHINESKKVVEDIDQESGQIVDSRPMTDDDLQESMV
jgi:hypothetical protein